MAEPLIYDLARLIPPLVAQAWDIPPHQIPYRNGGPREMVLHLLKIELCFTYAQAASLLDLTDTTAQKAVRQGEHLYTSSPTYQQRYDSVRDQVLNMLQLTEPGVAPS